MRRVYTGTSSLLKAVDLPAPQPQWDLGRMLVREFKLGCEVGTLECPVHAGIARARKWR